jgi:glucosamine--fructose-6-phosphate aminotransferase (isomerizing)
VCGIIAVVSRPARRSPPDPAELYGLLEEAAACLDGVGAPGVVPAAARCAELVERVDGLLHGLAGLTTLLDREAADAIAARTAAVAASATDLEELVDRAAASLASADLEAANASLLRLRDATWAIERDRLRNARAVADLAGADAGPAAVAAYSAVQTALSSLDRLEVRGRDSAGLHLLVRDHGLDLSDPATSAALAARAGDDRFTSGAVRTPDGLLSVVYKAAAEIGELGDNGRALREAVRGDDLLREALAADGARATVLCHTRWASVGIVSEANAHPLDSCELGSACGSGTTPYVVAAANGDVDNHLGLRERQQLRISADITTDGKVIPTLVSRHLAGSGDVVTAFRESAASFDGSVAIAACAADAPDQLLLALRGSGQGLFVGLAEDAFVVASEPYGVVEETVRYLRMDGEAPQGSAGPGQVVVLDAGAAGTLEGVRRLAYDGSELPVREADVQTRRSPRATSTAATPPTSS